MASIDILEQSIKDISHELLELLLVDKTTKGYIRWGTNQYYRHGADYRAEKEIFPDLIVGKHSKIIMPRSAKSEKEQLKRTKDKAEVFTAAWICNEQNNLIDEAWFGRKDVFNSQAEDHIWITNREPVIFPNGRTWKEYVDANRLEVSCGEAPYLVSLYDASNGVSIGMRIEGKKKIELFEQLEQLQQCPDEHIVVLVNTIIERVEVDDKVLQKLVRLIEEYIQINTLDEDMSMVRTHTCINIQLLPVMESIVYRYKIGFYDVSRKRGKVERKNKRNFN